MAIKSVILQFETVAERDRWAKELRGGIRRIFSTDPWLAGDFSADQIENVRRESKVEVAPDVRMRPFAHRWGLLRAAGRWGFRKAVR